MLKRTGFLIALISVMLVLAGCTAKYSFDFVAERDAENREGAWNEQTDIEYTDLGAYLDDDSLTSPFRFQGDFSVDVDFYVNTGDTNYLPWLEFYLIDSDGWDYNITIGLGMNMKSLITGSHWVGQTNGWSTFPTGPLPGLISNGANHLTISRTGDIVDIKLNSHIYDSITISAANVLSDYNFIITAYDDLNALHKGAYIQKVVVTHESGNKIPVATD